MHHAKKLSADITPKQRLTGAGSSEKCPLRPRTAGHPGPAHDDLARISHKEHQIEW